MNLSNPVNARFRFYRRNRRLSTCSPATGTAFLGLSLIPCSFFKDRLPSWQYQTISLGTLFIIEFMSIVKGKVCFVDNFPRFLFSRCRASRTNRNYSCLLNYVKSKKSIISINLRFTVLAHSSTLTLLSHL